MSLGSIMAEQRRLGIIATIAEAARYELNENIVRDALDRLWGLTVTHDVLRGDLNWLSEQGLLRVEKLGHTGDELWVAHLTASGQDVANGAAYPGIARPRAH